MLESPPAPGEEPETSEKAKGTVIGDASNIGLPGGTHLDCGGMKQNSPKRPPQRLSPNSEREQSAGRQCTVSDTVAE
jgi:hypothetical protein